ncbi:MAG TPA: cation:proton antiporter subunit C [Kiritimatiellia bacterium]|jgi:multicomponent Na+:H+ antiporter subunit C|nr:MAG: Na(+)/H(+) antiporter subunit C1 [Verrucomicrobia bacterium ADurb.Bin018]HOE00661.1 cation:proton antiporter subunit C [Kiritimatiellia bacterium]HOE36256.1 cation:proton antiporter subunit C [Kiritimatiellia bacterium]HOR73732.1 cation:proton antiporter subunit C [Kiritimatiellia bacterium]HOU58262.1 cation:proton antiporter subunit C [Kiritimatiellia bacterium]
MMTRLLLDLPFFTVVLLVVIGLGAMVLKRNLIKILMGLSILESAVNLFLVAIGYRQDGVAPIFTNVPSLHMVLPTVQALTLTSIVIGVATSAMMLSFAMILYKKYGTVDARDIRKLKG